MLEIKNLSKKYKLKNKQDIVALNNISIKFSNKGMVFLLGKSGSGKSTLLNVMGGLDTFDSGEIIIKGKSSSTFNKSDFDSYRNTFIGFVFQEYNILNEFSVGKNLEIALELQGKKWDNKKDKTKEILKKVDLDEEYYNRRSDQLSGGQKQRIAIARALIKNPEIIMADEPTGALDSKTGKQIMDLLKELSKTKLVIVVSHDRDFAEKYADRIIELKDGNIINDITKTNIEENTATNIVIDDNTISIKKGTKLTQENINDIINLLLTNVEKNENDTYISFLDKQISNDENNFTFRNTTNNDIKTLNYDGNLNFLHSKLSLKDSFKMGASSLKSKPFRLIVTIFLACVSLVMFGIVNTATNFNRIDSVYKSLQELNISNIGIQKRYGTESVALTSEDYNKIISSNNEDFNFIPVLYSNFDYEIVKLDDDNITEYVSFPSNNNNNNQLQKNIITGISDYSKKQGNIIYGREPNNTSLNLTDKTKKFTEICISLSMFNAIVENSDINNFEDLETKLLKISNYEDFYFEIVGVIDDENQAIYQEINTQINITKNLYSKISALYEFSTYNLCYINTEIFKNIYTNYYLNTDYSVEVCCEEGKITHSSITSWFDNSTSYTSNNLNQEIIDNIKLINIDNIENLKDNQIILNSFDLMDLFNNKKDIHTIENFIKSNSFYATIICNRNTIKTYEVVGYIDNDTYDINNIITKNEYDSYFKGYNSIIVKLMKNSKDKSLINYIENSKTPYFIMFESTDILDNYGFTFMELANWLIYVAVGFAIFSTLMLMNFISISITYKKKEIGILRAIGARVKDTFSIFFAESSIICFITFVLSSIFTFIVCNMINNAVINRLNLRVALLNFGILQIILILIISMVIAVVSTILPINKIAKMNPIDSINNRS